MGISTHILDTTRGRPAADVAVTLKQLRAGQWTPMGTGHTDADGRCKTLLIDAPEPGDYRLTFAVEAYFAARQTEAFFPQVQISFRVARGGEHFHVPLLLNPFGYSTYRGS